MRSTHPKLRRTLGWYKLPTGKVFHAYSEGRSLCGSYELPNMPEEGLTDGPDQSPSNCTICQKRIMGYRAAREEHCLNCRFGLDLVKNRYGHLAGTCAQRVEILWNRGDPGDKIQRQRLGLKLPVYCRYWAPSMSPSRGERP